MAGNFPLHGRAKRQLHQTRTVNRNGLATRSRCPLCAPQSSKAKRQIESPIDTEEIDLYDKLLRETDFARRQALMRLPALMVTDGP